MKRDTRSIILEEAFKLFCSKTYEQATVADLERTLKLTRGAIFYYVKNKEQLFREVVDEYLFGENSLLKRFDSASKSSLIEFINASVASMGAAKSAMFSYGIENMNFAFVNLTIQSLFYYPGYTQKLAKWREEELQSWNQILQKAVESGEVKSDIDVDLVSSLFYNVYYGTSYAGLILSTDQVEDLLHKEFMYIYESVKR